MKLLRLESICTHDNMQLFHSNTAVQQYMESFTAKNNFHAVMLNDDDDVQPVIDAWRQKFYENACNAVSDIFCDVPRTLFDYGFRFSYLVTEITVGKPFNVNWGGDVKGHLPVHPRTKVMK